MHGRSNALKKHTTFLNNFGCLAVVVNLILLIYLFILLLQHMGDVYEYVLIITNNNKGS